MIHETGSNSRKRGRETTAAPNLVNSFSLQSQSQSQSPQFIDLTQLHNQNVVSTGLGLSFGDQQLQQQQHGCYSSSLLSLLPDAFTLQIKQHHDQIDQFLQLQVPFYNTCTVNNGGCVMIEKRLVYRYC